MLGAYTFLQSCRSIPTILRVSRNPLNRLLLVGHLPPYHARKLLGRWDKGRGSHQAQSPIPKRIYLGRRQC